MTEGRSKQSSPMLGMIEARLDHIKAWFDSPLTKSNLYSTFLLAFLASYAMIALALYGLYALGLFS